MWQSRERMDCMNSCKHPNIIFAEERIAPSPFRIRRHGSRFFRLLARRMRTRMLKNCRNEWGLSPQTSLQGMIYSMIFLGLIQFRTKRTSEMNQCSVNFALLASTPLIPLFLPIGGLEIWATQFYCTYTVRKILKLFSHALLYTILTVPILIVAMIIVETERAKTSEIDELIKLINIWIQIIERYAMALLLGWNVYSNRDESVRFNWYFSQRFRIFESEKAKMFRIVRYRKEEHLFGTKQFSKSTI